jgi:DNA-binding GntR family transcriptional regulator
MDHLTTSALANLWQLSERRVRQILGQLEALGFNLDIDLYGARRVPQPLAQAVKEAREAQQTLRTLMARQDLRPFHKTGQELEMIEMVLELRAEQAIFRETIGEIWNSVETGLRKASHYRDVDWDYLGLPDPRRGL